MDDVGDEQASWSVIAEKSAASPKALGIPIAVRYGGRLDGTRKVHRSMVSATCVDSSVASARSRLAVVSHFAWSALAYSVRMSVMAKCARHRG